MNEINNRLNEILESSIIIDTLSHGPLLWSDDIIKANNEMLAQGMNPWDIIPILILQFARNVVNDEEYDSKYVEAWKESGVTCVSWTLGPMHSKPYSFDGVFHNFSYMTYMLDNRPDLFIKVLKGADIERAHKEGIKGIILNLQSMQHIGKDINMVELNYM